MKPWTLPVAVVSLILLTHAPPAGAATKVINGPQPATLQWGSDESPTIALAGSRHARGHSWGRSHRGAHRHSLHRSHKYGHRHSLRHFRDYRYDHRYRPTYKYEYRRGFGRSHKHDHSRFYFFGSFGYPYYGYYPAPYYRGGPYPYRYDPYGAKPDRYHGGFWFFGLGR